MFVENFRTLGDIDGNENLGVLVFGFLWCVEGFLLEAFHGRPLKVLSKV